jgi:hypothetical protein
MAIAGAIAVLAIAVGRRLLSDQRDGDQMHSDETSDAHPSNLYEGDHVYSRWRRYLGTVVESSRRATADGDWAHPDIWSGDDQWGVVLEHPDGSHILHYFPDHQLVRIQRPKGPGSPHADSHRLADWNERIYDLRKLRDNTAAYIVKLEGDLAVDVPQGIADADEVKAELQAAKERLARLDQEIAEEEAALHRWYEERFGG